ncbi:MAG: hypothetical protein KC535_04010 [Nanoarchaeota archaeon]|nr:hypothetical protein [Nanoarchaeota archaeon]
MELVEVHDKSENINDLVKINTPETIEYRFPETSDVMQNLDYIKKAAYLNAPSKATSYKVLGYDESYTKPMEGFAITATLILQYFGAKPSPNN